jgi:hypothetical protein
MIWLEFGHTTVACQSARESRNVNVTTKQLDWASAALEALVKGTCGIIR